jgi:hypothetical protein
VLEGRAPTTKRAPAALQLSKMRGFEGALVEAQAGQVGIRDSVTVPQIPVDRVVIDF